MHQSGHLGETEQLDEARFRQRLAARIDELDIAAARADVERFLRHPEAISVWSARFFHAVAAKIGIAPTSA